MSSTRIRYPWDTWFSKPRFQITKGKDFKCLVHGMIGQIRNVAAAKDISVIIKAKGDTITVSVRNPE